MPRFGTPTSCKVLSLDEGIIYLGGNVISLTVLLMKKALEKIIAYHEEGKRLYLILDLPEIRDGDAVGGCDFYAALRMAKLLLRYPGPVTTVVYRQAFSSGVWLSQLGDERLITAKSSIKFDHAGYHYAQEKRLTALGSEDIARELRMVDEMQLLLMVVLFGSEDVAIREVLRYFKRQACVHARTVKRLHLASEIIPEPKDLNGLVSYLSRRTDVFLETPAMFSEYY